MCRLPEQQQFRTVWQQYRCWSSIVAGSLFHNVLDVFDRNLLLPRIVVHERALLDKCFPKSKANAHIKTTCSMGCQIPSFVLCSHYFCNVCMFVLTQMFHYLREANFVPKESFATALSFSCIDRRKPPPRWSPRWVRGSSNCLSSCSPRSKAVHDGLHNGLFHGSFRSSTQAFTATLEKSGQPGAIARAWYQRPTKIESWRGSNFATRRPS